MYLLIFISTRLLVLQLSRLCLSVVLFPLSCFLAAFVFASAFGHLLLSLLCACLCFGPSMLLLKLVSLISSSVVIVYSVFSFGS